METHSFREEHPRRGTFNLNRSLAEQAEIIGGPEAITASDNEMVYASVYFYNEAYNLLVDAGIKPKNADVAEVVDYFLTSIGNDIDVSEADSMEGKYTSHIQFGTAITKALERTLQYGAEREIINSQYNPNIPQEEDAHDVGARLRRAFTDSVEMISEPIRDDIFFWSDRASHEAFKRFLGTAHGKASCHLGSLKTEIVPGNVRITFDRSGVSNFSTMDKRYLAYALVMEDMYAFLEPYGITGGTSVGMVDAMARDRLKGKDIQYHFFGNQVTAATSSQLYKRVYARHWKLNITRDDARRILTSNGTLDIDTLDETPERIVKPAPIGAYPFDVNGTNLPR